MLFDELFYPNHIQQEETCTCIYEHLLPIKPSSLPLTLAGGRMNFFTVKAHNILSYNYIFMYTYVSGGQ